MQVTAEIKSLFRSLRHRNFRLFFIGQLVSLVGTWMQNAAQAWLVLELTHSPFKLGVVTALQFLPMLFLAFFTGPFIDYFPKRKIIIAAQVVLMVQAFALAALVWTGAVEYWHVLVLATVLGVANTIDMPARQSFLIELVGRDDLMNAIGLNSAIFNAARALGPAVAGILIAALGTAVCFFVNGLSFLAVLASLFALRMTEPVRTGPPSYKILEDAGEALRAVRQTPVVRAAILLVAVVSILGANFNVLVPVFAKDELMQDAAGFGFLMSSFGIGALIGAVSLTIMSKLGPKPALLLGSGLALSLFLVVLGFQRMYGFSALLLALCGWCIVSFYGTANTTVQLNTPDRLRGRVMSIYTMAFAGLSPIGSVFAGTVAHWLRASLTFAVGGLICGIVFLAVIAKGKKGTVRSKV
jgi:MFS family permease